MKAEFSVASDGIRRALDHVASEVARIEADARIANRLSVIVDEMVANMIRHDPLLDAGTTFRIEMRREGDAIRMILSDPGTEFNPLGFMHAETPEIGGHGISVIKNLSREVSWRRAGGRNVLEVVVDARALDI